MQSNESLGVCDVRMTQQTNISYVIFKLKRKTDPHFPLRKYCRIIHISGFARNYAIKWNVCIDHTLQPLMHLNS